MMEQKKTALNSILSRLRANPQLGKLLDYVFLSSLTICLYSLFLQLVENPSFSYTVGAIFVAQWISFATMAFMVDWAVKSAMKQTFNSLGVSSIEELKERSNQVDQYQKALNNLGPADKMKIMDKYHEMMSVIAEYEKQPEWYFKNKGTTKEEALKQVNEDFNAWMKSNNYPTLEDFKKNSNK